MKRNRLRLFKRSLKIGKVFGRQDKADSRLSKSPFLSCGSHAVRVSTKSTRRRCNGRHYLRNARTTVRNTESVYRLMTLSSGPRLEENRDAVLGLCNQRCGMPVVHSERHTHIRSDPVGSNRPRCTTPCLSEPRSRSEKGRIVAPRKIRVCRLINIRPALCASLLSPISITSVMFFAKLFRKSEQRATWKYKLSSNVMIFFSCTRNTNYYFKLIKIKI